VQRGLGRMHLRLGRDAQRPPGLVEKDNVLHKLPLAVQKPKTYRQNDRGASVLLGGVLLGIGRDLLGLAGACYAGIGGAETAAAPARGIIALLPGADFIGEVAIPMGGCFLNMVSSTWFGLNIFS
jgi:hypothetical protein